MNDWSFSCGDSGGELFKVIGMGSPIRLSEAEQEQIRWYLEDYPETFANKADSPEHAIAKEVAALIQAAGESLYSAVAALPQAACVLPLLDLSQAEFSISGNQSIPWEIMRRPSERPFSVLARRFIRSPLAQVPERSLQDTLRVLWIISRPKGEDDLPFRTVAQPVVDRLGPSVQVKSLRSVTMEQLKRELGAARDLGKAFHAVHFDGHGVTDKSGRGFIVLANFGEAGERVDGACLGRLLARYGVSFLILNSCRSAWTLPLPKPGSSEEPGSRGSYTSFAAEALAEGVPGVVGVSYAIFPRTAVLFLSELYTALAGGATLAEATGRARRVLWSAPDSRFADWMVPVVYEREAIRLSALASVATGSAREPVLNRDAMVAQIEQAFERTGVVLLRGEAGIGKTTTAQDFGAWYERTEGCVASVFTSFQRPPTVEALAMQLRFLRESAKQTQGRSLWIWDNLESAALLPEAERQALREELLEMIGPEICVLVTSRRNETDWLDAAAVETLVLPRLNRRESWSLAREASRFRLNDEALRPLVEFSAGNPLTLRMLAGTAVNTAAVAADLTSALVARLQLGGGPVSEDNAETETVAVFDWVFQSVLTPTGRDVAAVTHLFGQAVHGGLFEWMAHESNDDAVPFLRAARAQSCRELVALLSDLGILHPAGELYQMHPLGSIFVKRCWLELSKKAREEAETGFVHAAGRHAESLIETKDKGGLASSFDAAPYEEYFCNAFELARRFDLYDAASLVARVLGPLLGAQNRAEEHWKLYDGIAPMYMDVVTGKPRPGRERGWNLIMASLSGAAHQRHHYNEARRLYEDHLAVLREQWVQAGEFGDLDHRRLVGGNLVSTLKAYAYLLRELGGEWAPELLQEAFTFAKQLGLTRLQADLAYDLAEVYREAERVRNLDLAKLWIDVAMRVRSGERSDARSNDYMSLGRILLQMFLRDPTSERAVELLRQNREALWSAHGEAAAGNGGLLLTIEFHLACACAAGEDGSDASQWFTSALKRAATAGDERTENTIHAMRAHLAEERGRDSEALAYGRKALEGLRKERQRPPFAAEIQAKIEELLVRCENRLRPGLG